MVRQVQTDIPMSGVFLMHNTVEAEQDLYIITLLEEADWSTDRC